MEEIAIGDSKWASGSNKGRCFPSPVAFQLKKLSFPYSNDSDCLTYTRKTDII